jgi:uncharacterized repeat protein (TIGR03803 family)
MVHFLPDKENVMKHLRISKIATTVMLIAAVCLLTAAMLPAQIIQDLHNFGTGTENGENPERATLVKDSNGNIFGTTANGGYANLGTVYEYSATGTFSVVYGFGSTKYMSGDGGHPIGGLATDSHCNLYGVTQIGGVHGDGIVYELSPSSCPVTGATTWKYDGCDIVIGGTITCAPLWTFDYNSTTQDGAYSVSGLFWDAKRGHLYGTTNNGGNPSSYGIVFQLVPPSGDKTPWKETIVHVFAGGTNDGARPQAGVIMDSHCNLYGTTQRGGVANIHGVAYEISAKTCPESGTPTWPSKSAAPKVLHAFTAVDPDGENPESELLMDSHCNLYGTTLNGGIKGLGTAYELKPSSCPVTSTTTFTHATIHSFLGANVPPGDKVDGVSPVGGLTINSGALYGTTYYGGSRNAGIIYELFPPTAGSSSWTENILHAFQGGRDDGASGDNTPLLESSGDLWLTTVSGGANSVGALLELSH